MDTVIKKCDRLSLKKDISRIGCLKINMLLFSHYVFNRNSYGRFICFEQDVASKVVDNVKLIKMRTFVNRRGSKF